MNFAPGWLSHLQMLAFQCAACLFVHSSPVQFSLGLCLKLHFSLPVSWLQSFAPLKTRNLQVGINYNKTD